MSATMQPPGQPPVPQQSLVAHPMGPIPPPAGPVGVPPGAMPNPAFAQWQQANQQRQAIIASNAQKQTQFEAACDLLRKDGLRGFKLDIEADSTIAPDEQAEKQSRVEFMQQFVPFIQNLAPAAQGNPTMADLLSEAAMFVVRGFRVARPLEESIEKAFKTLGGMPPIGRRQPDQTTGRANDAGAEAATGSGADAD